MTATLYLLDALIDNPDDLTRRATRIMREVPRIVAPASEGARSLLQQCNMDTSVIWLDRLDPQAHLDAILDALHVGDVAWLHPNVTEWSEPDYALVQALYKHDIDLVPVPGPDSAITGLVLSGLPASRFSFLGTLPAVSSSRRSALQSTAGRGYTVVCRVRAADLAEALDDIKDVLGERHMTVCPEPDMLDRIQPASGDETSTVTIVIQGESQDPKWPADKVQQQVRTMLAAGDSTRDVARSVAARSGWSKRQVYGVANRIRELDDDIL